jgi:hypothetical protein
MVRITSASISRRRSPPAAKAAAPAMTRRTGSATFSRLVITDDLQHRIWERLTSP